MGSATSEPACFLSRSTCETEKSLEVSACISREFPHRKDEAGLQPDWGPQLRSETLNVVSAPFSREAPLTFSREPADSSNASGLESLGEAVDKFMNLSGIPGGDLGDISFGVDKFLKDECVAGRFVLEDAKYPPNRVIPMKILDTGLRVRNFQSWRMQRRQEQENGLAPVRDSLSDIGSGSCSGESSDDTFVPGFRCPEQKLRNYGDTKVDGFSIPLSGTGHDFRSNVSQSGTMKEEKYIHIWSQDDPSAPSILVDDQNWWKDPSIPKALFLRVLSKHCSFCLCICPCMSGLCMCRPPHHLVTGREEAQNVNGLGPNIELG